MPRTRIPNPRFLSADSSLLPFLAPRAFTETPISKRNKQCENDTRRLHKEKKPGDERTPERALKGSRCEAANQESNWRNQFWTSTTCTKRDSRNIVKDFVQPSVLTRYRNKLPTQKTLDQRYVDIFAFACQQTRNYSTMETAATNGVILPSNVASIHRQNRRWRVVRSAPAPVKWRSLLAKRRAQALALEQIRMDKFLSNKRGVAETDLAKTGRYRSLLRRVMNLQRYRHGVVDMGKHHYISPSRIGLTRAFVALDRVAYPKLRRKTPPIMIKHDPRCPKWALKLFNNTNSSERDHVVLKNWMGFNEEERNECWHHLLIYLLRRMPARALDFIQVLGYGPRVYGLEPQVLADSLEHLARIYIGEKKYAPRQTSDGRLGTISRKFIPVFFHTFRQHLRQHRHICSQDLLYSLVNMANIEELKTVFDLLVEAHTYLGYDTLLHYANAFGTAGEHEFALRCLVEMKRRSNTDGWSTVVDRQRFRWTCAVILRRSMSKANNYHAVPGIVAALVGLGVKLDITLYNVVMHNAMDAGDYATAFRVYNALGENGLKPERITFSILLHGCTRQSTPAMFHDFAEYCAQIAIQTKSSRLAAGYLYYVYICHYNDKDIAQISSILWQAYKRFFSTGPLKPFLDRNSERLESGSDQDQFKSMSEALMPPSLAMYIMLQTEIRKALSESSERVWSLYQLFKRVIEVRSDVSTNVLAKDITIWNSFLHAFCQKQQFASASQVIKDMTENSPQPNIYSWNIFMQAFFKNGQVRAAERVFEIMRNRNIDPDQYTYGVMLRGYAKAQMLPQIEETMEHLDTEEQLDPDLLQALAKVHERRKLLVALERNRLELMRREREKANRKAEEEKRRWLPLHSSWELPRPKATNITNISSESSIESELSIAALPLAASDTQTESSISQPRITRYRSVKKRRTYQDARSDSVIFRPRIRTFPVSSKDRHQSSVARTEFSTSQPETRKSGSSKSRLTRIRSTTVFHI